MLLPGKIRASAVPVDPNGYIAYCPCMGRFGNQADQFLGSLAFAKSLNRTLLLPAWVEYRRYQTQSVQVPFDTYFKVEALQEYHRVMIMEQFMKELSPTIWPEGSRISFCYMARAGLDGENSKDSCKSKDGNPFKSFWDTYNVEFDRSEFFKPLYYNTESTRDMKEWSVKYPPSEYPVLAFTGPPAAFPVSEFHVRLQKYVQWSDSMASKAQELISKNIPSLPFIGLHLRNGADFKKACEHISSSPNMFAAPQCLGYRGQHGSGYYELCFPDDTSVIKQVKAAVKKLGAKSVFVATDDRDLIKEFSKAIKEVKFVRQPEPADPMLDLAVLGQADHFIGNCISTFTAFVKRERDAVGKSSEFWSFPPKATKTTTSDKVEL